MADEAVEPRVEDHGELDIEVTVADPKTGSSFCFM